MIYRFHHIFLSALYEIQSHCPSFQERKKNILNMKSFMLIKSLLRNKPTAIRYRNHNYIISKRLISKKNRKILLRLQFIFPLRLHYDIPFNTIKYKCNGGNHNMCGNIQIYIRQENKFSVLCKWKSYKWIYHT